MKRVIGCLFILLLGNLKAQVVNESALFHYYKQKANYSQESTMLTAFKPRFITPKEDSGKFTVNPLLDMFVGVQNKDDRSVNGLGVGLTSTFVKKRWSIGFDYLFQNAHYMDYQRAFIAENRVVPGMGISRGSDRHTSYYISSYINFKANNIFDFEIGFGKNFIGDGYRSLLLSDAANSSPYLKINTSFWKIKYTNLFASHQNIFNVEGDRDLYQKKYTATHFLDFKASKWLSIGLFETIVWQAQEANFTRGFDPTYANPFIFYRPVEFSIGSSDNALVGANIKVTPIENHVFYGQLVFDEFLLDELRADVNQWRNPDQDILSGWWANKYGIQIGWKTYDFLKIEGLQTLVEFNFVRPYTYAHSAPTQAYTNFNTSLAHPLGANFHEFIAMTSYQKEKWNGRIQFNQSRKGFSGLGENLGENLQFSNATRTNEYENTTGQGDVSIVRYAELSLGHQFPKLKNTNINVGYIWREEQRADKVAVNSMIFLRIKTLLFNQYWDY